MSKPSSLSKSKLISFRQCPKRLWLEVNAPVQGEVSAATQMRFDAGHKVGEVSQRLYAMGGPSVLIDTQVRPLQMAYAATQQALLKRVPVFEAGFAAEFAGGKAHAFADVLLPVKLGRRNAWRMVEVKSTKKLKAYHYDDAAIQAAIAKSAGLQLASIAIAHLDGTFKYPGANRYGGLLREQDVTEQAFARGDEVADWITQAHKLLRKRTEPDVQTGSHCNKPNPCAFIDYCSSQEERAKYPISWLPNPSKRLQAWADTQELPDVRHVPDDLLSAKQLRVKTAALKGKVFFDREGAAEALRGHKLPAYFLDFESVNPAVPIWVGIGPYEHVPFQYSLHRLSRTGKLEHFEFLDVTGDDPSSALARQLVQDCAGNTAPVFAYYASFERDRLQELAQRNKVLAPALLNIAARLVDLLPMTRAHFYHPSQLKSWSLKAVLPAMFPKLSYDNVEGVQDGLQAQQAYQQAAFGKLGRQELFTLITNMRRYCAQDTFATVKVWGYLVQSAIHLEKMETQLDVSEVDFAGCVRSYFLQHPSVKSIEPTVRQTKHGVVVTSPYFVPGLRITFNAAGADIMWTRRGGVSDWMGHKFCKTVGISHGQYINLEDLDYYDKDQGAALQHRPLSQIKKYASQQAVYEQCCLDKVIEDIQSGKLLQPIEWKDSGGSVSAHFDGYPPHIGDTDTKWVYPLKVRAAIAEAKRKVTREATPGAAAKRQIPPHIGWPANTHRRG